MPRKVGAWYQHRRDRVRPARALEGACADDQPHAYGGGDRGYRVGAMSGDHKRKTLGERFDGWSRRSLIFVAVSASAVFISSIVVIVGGIKDVVRWAEPARDWRPAEYGQLEALRAGYTLAEFEHVLGTPLFSRPAAPALTENIFHGRDYWAQAITNRSATVVVYAVTSCSTNFTPTFHVPIPSQDGKGTSSVTLNRTRFTEVLPAREEERVHADYNTGASADQWYLDKYYGANPGFYKSYAWGLNDACPDWFSFFSKLERESLTRSVQ